MTKTESANRTVQAVVIEACEQLLECQMAAGVRLAIPNTNNLIMVGPQEWIAKNVPGVGAMVEAEQTLDAPEFMDALCKFYEQASCEDFDQVAYKSARTAVLTRLAATTQASTAQAEPKCAICKDTGRYADEYITTEAGHEPILHDCDCGGAPATVAQGEQDSATSSTDAQAAAEVRDAARYRFLREKMCFSGGASTPTTMQMRASLPAPDHDHHKDWMGDRFDASVDATIDRALRAGDTGEQADGGAR